MRLAYETGSEYGSLYVDIVDIECQMLDEVLFNFTMESVRLLEE